MITVALLVTDQKVIHVTQNLIKFMPETKKTINFVCGCGISHSLEIEDGQIIGDTLGLKSPDKIKKVTRLGRIYGDMEVVLDPTMKPGEWRLEEGKRYVNPPETKKPEGCKCHCHEENEIRKTHPDFRCRCIKNCEHCNPDKKPEGFEAQFEQLFDVTVNNQVKLDKNVLKGIVTGWIHEARAEGAELFYKMLHAQSYTSHEDEHKAAQALIEKLKAEK